MKSDFFEKRKKKNIAINLVPYGISSMIKVIEYNKKFQWVEPPVK